MRTISCLAALAFVVAIAAQGSAGASSSPSEMTWTDTGQQGGGPITFTAASPLCPSGTVRDVGGTVGIKQQYTCADGSGSFEFEVIGVAPYHFSSAGTGRYASLRGTGSCRVMQNGDGTFTRPCHALADFDSTAPSARITSVRISRAGHALKLRIAFEASDNVEGNAVSYRLSATAVGHTLGHASGTTPGGAVQVNLRVKLPKHAKRVVVSVKVADPLHNSRTVTRSASVPR